MQAPDEPRREANEEAKGDAPSQPAAAPTDVPEGDVLEADVPEGEAAEGAERAADEEEAPRFAVRDRRFWARGGDEAADDADDKPPRAEKPSYVADLEAKLAEKDQRLKQYIEAHRDAERQFAQARERLEREQAREIEREKDALVGRFFDVLDNMDRSLEAAESAAGDGAGSGDAFAGLRDGVRIVHRQLVAVLADLGLERIDPLGEPFDPNLHDAMSVTPVAEEAQDNVVQQVFRCGYRRGEQVLRPAMVIVGRHVAG